MFPALELKDQVWRLCVCTVQRLCLVSEVCSAAMKSKSRSCRKRHVRCEGWRSTNNKESKEEMGERRTETEQERVSCEKRAQKKQVVLQCV